MWEMVDDDSGAPFWLSCAPLEDPLADLLRLVGAAIILFVMDWRLALLVILPVPPLAIALRLSAIRRADTIIALENGRIREVGSHEELIQLDGLYSQLYRRQIEPHG